MSCSMHTLSRKPPVDLNQSAVSRYLQLATLFRRRVETGEWAVGEQFPRWTIWPRNSGWPA